MINFNIPLNSKQEEISGWTKFINTLKRLILFEKMYNPLGFIILTLISCLFAYYISATTYKNGVVIIVGLIAPCAFVWLVRNPKYQVITYLTLSFSIMYLLALGVTFPLGTVMDGLLLMVIIDLLTKLRKSKEWYRLHGKISKTVIVWIVYLFFEVGNPAAESRQAWVFTIRTMGVVAISFYAFIYHIRTKEFMRTLITIVLTFHFIAAWYAFKQEYIGYFQFEEDYLHSSEEITQLLFLAGHWRKYSIFSDPVTFAYNMVGGSLYLIGRLTGPVTKKRKWLYFFLIYGNLHSMLFSGTRGAFPLIPVTLILYVIMKFSKNILIGVGIAMVFMVFLINVPTSNQNILRFQTAFSPGKDESYYARQVNQYNIKPYEWTHPIGGGLGSTGTWGKRFSPGSFLSTFPPDSGYVRTTVETGIIGLIIFCVMMYTMLKTGIDNYYSIRDPELKSICLGCIFLIFALNIGNFPQEALVQYPSNTLFYLSAALIVTTKRIDDQQNLKLDAS